MLLLTMSDAAGNRIQVNGESIAFFTQDKAGKGSVIAFAVPGGSGFMMLNVSDTVDAITTQINAKLRK